MRFLCSYQRTRALTPSFSLSRTRSLLCSAACHVSRLRKYKDPSTLHHRRSFSSAPFSSPPQHQIYISNSTNPYFNLTFEDWLFRHAPPDTPLLFIYRDAPCIVIGRHQNPWKEINFPALRTRSLAVGDSANAPAGIPIIRRRSGGGTVYHDLGNTNFSIHLSRTLFDRYVTAQMVVRAVRSLGVAAHVNGRNDICVGSSKHVSGSAYKIVSKRAYHHGTMLISTDLTTLGDVLKPMNKGNMVSKGVASVPSPVCNLQRFDSSITHAKFISAVIDEFRAQYGIPANVPRCIVSGAEEALNSIEYIQQGMAELPSWDWAIGQTPEFTHTVNRSFPWGEVTARIHSKHGIILSSTLQVDNSSLSKVELERLYSFSKSFENRRYDPEDIANLVGSDQISKDFGAWMLQVIRS